MVDGNKYKFGDKSSSLYKKKKEKRTKRLEQENELKLISERAVEISV